MSKAEFLQGLRNELEGRVPYSVIQENLNYYDSYISKETAGGTPEEAVIEALGGPRIIARTIVDAAFDTEDRPDGYETYGSGTVYDADSGSSGASGQENGQGPYGQDPFREEMHRNVHYVNLSGWKGRLIAGLVVFVILFLLMTVFFGVVGLAGLILSYTWPILLILLIIWIFAGRR
ncbi:MAG TPA: hypothetical protein H9704_06430 [Candidatus Enterocloster excrementipullorum]|uniref:DUF1700 domain-containing protein n=1 Tax=Candidatus Enterocloster excrementipullorum TaxID=2838559 RepID=A0A9D2N0D2_9FIRM|nr:hypothetical protein [Candidatus Enterocloster excrementipullorum]